MQAIYDHFSPDPYRFEACAIELWKMAAKESVSVIATRRSRDSGRDAYGTYSIGPSGDRVHLDFSLEAKCYKPGHGCGVKDTSRLISRLRHRQFGVFVTTSHVGPQPYQEIREDGHPVVILAGRDIAELLKQHGISTVAAVTVLARRVLPDTRVVTAAGQPPSRAGSGLVLSVSWRVGTRATSSDGDGSVSCSPLDLPTMRTPTTTTPSSTSRATSRRSPRWSRASSGKSRS